MDWDALIGARLVVGIPGLEATEEVAESLRRIHAQSLILFRRDFSSCPQLGTLLRRLEESLGRKLLVMIDHEGGDTFRLGDGLTHFPDARTMSKEGARAIEQQGRIEAKELRKVGISVNLAPCVDVVQNGCDPVIGNRSYGGDPKKVGELSAARIKGLQREGVWACAKHFPGLGAVPQDPHKVLPTIELSWSEMERVHLQPFRSAIGGDVAMIMSSHVCYPELGLPEQEPATFSRRLMHDLLRERLGFQGVTITDDLEMGAIRSNGAVAEAAVKAAEAGHDLLLICCTLSAAEGAFKALRQAYQSGRLSQEDLLESVNRIQQMRQKFSTPALASHR